MWRGNTHLWVVNRAIDQLANSGDSQAVMVANLMKRSSCQTQWQQGLWDGDDDNYKDASGYYMGSHFYNAAGLDYKGNPTSYITYNIA